VSDRSIAISPLPVSSLPSPTRPAAPKTRLLLEGPVLSTLLRVATPNVLNLLALAGMITFDGLFLGRLGADALAGVSLAFPWVMLIMHATNGGMGGGVSSAIARALGAGRRDRADALVHHAFILALALAALFSTSMLLGAPFVFRWMGGEGEMLSAALAYSNAAFGGAVSICMLNLLGNAVRGTGNMSLPATVIVGSVLAHIVISPLLIFGWGPSRSFQRHGWDSSATTRRSSVSALRTSRSPARFTASTASAWRSSSRRRASAAWWRP
jgi:Na+-driven multidrug efflux pump